MIEKVGFNFRRRRAHVACRRTRWSATCRRCRGAVARRSRGRVAGPARLLRLAAGRMEGESPDSAHYTPIRDLRDGGRVLNRGVQSPAAARVDFVHMPVQLARDQRDGHYAPLPTLGSRRGRRPRLPRAPRRQRRPGGRAGHTPRNRQAPPPDDFGVGTSCGWGRRPLEESVQDLIDLEHDVARAVTNSGVQIGAVPCRTAVTARRPRYSVPNDAAGRVA